MHFNWQKFSGVSELLPFPSQFFGLKMEKSHFLQKKRFECIFIELKCRWLQTSLADLEKHLTFVFFLWVDFFTHF